MYTLHDEIKTWISRRGAHLFLFGDSLSSHCRRAIIIFRKAGWGSCPYEDFGGIFDGNSVWISIINTELERSFGFVAKEIREVYSDITGSMRFFRGLLSISVIRTIVLSVLHVKVWN